MHATRFFLFVSSLALAAALHASAPDSSRTAVGSGASVDSLSRVFALDEIVVTATRWGASSSAVPAGVTVISHDDIQSVPGNLLSAALSGTPGLSLRSYGGGSSLQTVSLRGMAPEHTLVLVDGQRYNSFQNGLADFGLLSSAPVDHVEVVRGGESALYGADAIGGVINVITTPPPEGLHGSFVAGIGSAHSGSTELQLGGGWGDFGGRGLIRRDQGRGDYEFRYDDGQTQTMLRRSDGDYSVLTGDFRGDVRLSPTFRGTASFSYTDADRGSPEAVTDPSSGGSARLWDRLEVLRGAIDWDPAEIISVRLNGSAQYSYEHYDNPGELLNGTELRDLYTNHDYIITPQALFRVSPALSGLAGVEYARVSLASSETQFAVRVQRSAFMSTEHIIRLPWVAPFEMIFYPSVRYDAFSDVSGDISPKLGLNIGLLKDPGLRLRASYGKSFRAPDFNDLYWLSGGNPFLRPERALAFDAGLRADLPLWGSLRLDASYFSIDCRDRIVWVPSIGTLWSPKNISSAVSRGFEVEASWSGLDGALRITLNSTWTDVKKTSADYPGDPTQGKRLIYEPPQTFNAIVQAKIGGVDIYLRHSWISYRYTTEVNDQYLPDFTVASAALRYGIPLGPFTASFKVEVNNLFNSSYQVIALYPMPMRDIRGTLGIEL